MLLVGDKPRLSVRDLASLRACEFEIAAAIDGLLGKRTAVPVEPDPLLTRLAPLGREAEAAFLERAERELGPAARPRHPAPGLLGDAQEIAACIESLRQAVDGRTPLIYQPLVVALDLHGFPDFLVWDDEASAYVVVDAKYGGTPKKGRSGAHPKADQPIQVATYAVMLEALGVPVGPVARLEYSDGGRWEVAISEMRASIEDLLAQRDALVLALTASTSALPWDEFRTCGTCAACAPFAAEARDVLGCQGIGPSFRDRLRAEGIATIDDLASATQSTIPGVAPDRFARFVGQAQLQVAANPAGAPALPPIAEVSDPRPIQDLPSADPGDLFFDFEGDLNWGPIGAASRGLEYLWGITDVNDSFTPIWAHDRAAEAVALQQFLAFVEAARTARPDMHIHHYGSYELAALRRVAKRTGHDLARVEELIASGIFVDLLPVAKGSLRTSQSGFSIKKLEPFYMGDDLRVGVATAGDSIAAYFAACEARDAGDLEQWNEILANIADYNRYDCVSTRRLLEWLRGLVAV